MTQLPLKSMNASIQSGSNMPSLVEQKLSSPLAPNTFKLDPDQQALVDRWNDPLIIVSAGPGAGKTTTLCALVGRIHNEAKQARILMLAYNVNAEDIMKQRLATQLVRVESKESVASDKAGCWVITFDKYGHHARTGPHKKPSRGNDFKKALEAAAELPMLENWDWIIIDEAQDVSPLHAKIIKQLRDRSKHTVIAGDPRQEICDNAGWFSRLWRDSSDNERCILRYNHRSVPRLVELLNIFSRHHFPSIHHDQIPWRDAITHDDKDNTFTWSAATMNTQKGVYAADIMSKYQPSQVYCIAPVSVTRWRMDEVTNTFRNEMFIRNKLANVKVFTADDSRDSLDNTKYFVGTAAKFKGTERKHVIVLRPDAPYTPPCPREAIIKKLFVCISRAEDSLRLIMDKKPNYDDILDPLFHRDALTHKKENDHKKGEKKSEYVLGVTDDLIKLPCWGAMVKSTQSIKLTPLKIECKSDEDFVGHFAEAHVATAAGAELAIPRIQEAKIYDDELGEGTGIFSGKDGKYIAIVDPRSWKKQAEAFSKLEKTFETHPQYAFAAMKYSIKIRKPWEVSTHLMTSYPDKKLLASYGDLIRKYLGVKDLQLHGKMIELNIMPHRQLASMGTLRGEIDFAADEKGIITRIIEMKHANSSDTHYHQASIYAAMSSIESAAILNTLQGTFTTSQAFQIDYVNDIARALLALKHACTCEVTLKLKRDHIPNAGAYIATSIKTIGECVVEVAALAFEAGTSNILSRFHKCANGTIDVRGESDKFNMGLCISDKAEAIVKEDLPLLTKLFHQWVNNTTSSPTFLCWSPDELKHIGYDKSNCINMNDYFHSWCYSTFLPDKGIVFTLKSAIDRVFGSLEPYVPHRAYEDAVMTAALFNAISHTGGIL